MSTESYLIAQYISLLGSNINTYNSIQESIEKLNLLINNNSLTQSEQNLVQQFRRLKELCLKNEKNSIKNIEIYIDLYKKFKFKSISDVTANKCIIDSLGNPISDISNIQIDVSEVNDELLKMLKNNPNYLYLLPAYKFEEVIAEILTRKGYEVTLTQPTHDGGKDIYAASKNDFGSFLYIVECKKYKPTHKVGINVLRNLYGVLSKERAT